MEPTTETPKQNILAEDFFRILKTRFPEANPELTELDGVSIILYDFPPIDEDWPPADPDDLELFSRVWEKYFPVDPVKTPLEFQQWTGATVNSLDFCGRLPVAHCLEIKAPNGQRFYALARTEYGDLQHHGVHQKTERLEALLKQWFASHPNAQDSDLESEAEKALIGDYQYIVPLLADLKPACFFYKTKPDGTETPYLKACWRLLGKIEELMPGVINSIQGELPNEFLYYGPKTVRNVIEKHPDVFRAIGITDSMSVEQIMECVFRKKQATHYQAPQEQIMAVGLLLGYDQTSVREFSFLPARNRREGCFNIWGVDYNIAKEKQNPDFLRLKNQYDELLRYIETMLMEGQSPMAILKILPGFAEIRDIRAATADSTVQVY